MGLKQNQALAAQYPVLQYFKVEHLPEALKVVSRPFGALAWKMSKTLPDNHETRKALDKLLEAKDAAVRSFIAEPVLEQE